MAAVMRLALEQEHKGRELLVGNWPRPVRRRAGSRRC